MFSQDDIQFVMYMCTNSVGSSTAVVSLFTTSIECKLMSIFTSTVKYLYRGYKIRSQIDGWSRPRVQYTNEGKKVANLLFNF